MLVQKIIKNTNQSLLRNQIIIVFTQIRFISHLQQNLDLPGGVECIKFDHETGVFYEFLRLGLRIIEEAQFQRIEPLFMVTSLKGLLQFLHLVLRFNFGNQIFEAGITLLVGRIMKAVFARLLVDASVQALLYKIFRSP